MGGPSGEEGRLSLSESMSLRVWLENFQSVKHRLDARDFVGSKRSVFPSAASTAKNGSAPRIPPEVFERVGSALTHRKSQRPQTERVQENRHLATDPRRAVLQVR